METSNFKKGDLVTYIPTHAKENRDHKDWEDGVVKSINQFFVFVIYNNCAMEMKTGDEPYTAAATRPEDLVRR